MVLRFVQLSAYKLHHRVQLHTLSFQLQLHQLIL
nr:MAG TPA: hypothetical protein [Caudoviricetes sp.]